MTSLVEIQEAYIADLVRCQSVTRCYGNRGRAEVAAYKRTLRALLDRGYTEKDAKVILRDAGRVFDLRQAAGVDSDED